MPYIKKEDRAKFADYVFPSIDSPGELNYVLTGICMHYLDNGVESYTKYNEVIGALECCKLELYRRKISKYEDVKITENGDVY